MTSLMPTRRAGLVPSTSWLGVSALMLGFLLGSSGAMAAAPPANTIIGNQASATYLDPNGASQLATSNLVQTTVQQVGSFNLDGFGTVTTNVVNTKTGAAGTTVYAPHVLTNTGNGSDTFTLEVKAPASPDGFTKVEVFADANGDGVPDSTTALCSAVPAATCNVPAQTVAGGGTFPFVVAYSIPSTATSATFTSPVAATITATAGTPALYAASNTQAADVDNVNLTTLAAFDATKSLSVPAVNWVNGGAWPVASTSGPRSVAGCAATVAGASAPAAGCVYTTYTLRFNNTGGAAGRFFMTDDLPSGFTYVPGSAVWSSAPGTALGDGAGGDPVGIDYAASGSTLTFVVDNLAQNASQTVSFVVLVNSTASVGTSTTTNTANYNPTSVPPETTSTTPPPGPKGPPTNPSTYTVVGTFGLVLGSGDVSASPTASLDSSAGVPNTSVADTTTMASAGAGTTVKFTQTAFNTGNASDIVNLAAAIGSFPPGTTFKFFAADGLTPLIDNNGDGIVDTGPVAAGGSVKFVLAASLPSPTPIPAGPFSAIVTGTSTGDSTKSETTRDTLTTMLGVLVDLTNTASGNGTAGNTGNGDVGSGPSPQPTTTQSTPAGTGTVFTLFVKNNDTVLNTYSLAASQTNSFPGGLPTGWTVKFVAQGAGCAGTAITTVDVPANGGQTPVDACVTPPSSQVPTTTPQSVYFQVRSTIATSTGVVAIDTKQDAVTVTAPNTFSATLTPNNNGQVAPGGSVVYAHTLTNTGGQSCVGPYTFTATLPAADTTAGWTTSLYIDVNGDGQIDAGDTLVTGPIAGPLAVGGTQKLLVKVFAPGGASAGTVDTATVTVTFPAGANSCGAPSATDVTTVVTGQMRLLKTQALDTNCDGIEVPSASTPLVAKPGECIVYRVVASNEGVAPVTNMSINDAVPAFTSLTGAAQPASQCVSTGVTPALAAANYTSTPTTVACGSTTNTVAPGGTATMTFSVKVNN